MDLNDGLIMTARFQVHEEQRGENQEEAKTISVCRRTEHSTGTHFGDPLYISSATHCFSSKVPKLAHTLMKKLFSAFLNLEVSLTLVNFKI